MDEVGWITTNLGVMMSLKRVLLIPVIVLLCGCGRDVAAPSDRADDTRLASALEAAGVEPMCQIGCQEPDPNPSAPGVFLGSGVTSSLCIDGDYTDGDVDGVGDFCEDKLADAFAPELYYAYGDNVAREPKWVSRKLDSGRVLIGYLISYYRDEGSTNSWACQLPPVSPTCSGHNGDSENVFLAVGYNISTQHWVLNYALYSVHGDYNVYSAGSDDYPTALYYPARIGGYPRTYVAQGKHANYSSIRDCNRGGPAGTDYCGDVDTAARLEVGSYTDIGSRAHPTMDCVAATNSLHPDYYSGRQECYWTDRGFQGWYSQQAGDLPQSYSSILANQGF